MRHGNKVKKLSRTTSHRRALVRNLATSLFKYERIITTVEKAKFIRPFAEKLITKAKTDTVASRRLVFQTIRDEAVLNKLFTDIAKRYQNRPGGYTRIIRLGYRSNDGAERAIIELVEEKLENASPSHAK